MLLLSIFIILLNTVNITKLSHNWRLNDVNHKHEKNLIEYPQIFRLAFLILIFCFILSLNSLNIQLFHFDSFQGISSSLMNYDYSKINIFNSYFQISLITQSLDLFLYFIGAILILILNSQFIFMDTRILNDSKRTTFIQDFEYIILLFISLLGTTLLISTNNFIALILCIELQSFSMYLIASFNKDHFKSQNAGIIYFLLGSLSSCFIFLGFFLIYANTGILNFEDFYNFIAISNNLNNWLQFAFLIFFLGFLFKLAAAPFHHWSLTVYDQVPTLVTSWIAIIPKISFLYIILDFVLHSIQGQGTENQDFYHWTYILAFTAILSLLFGSIPGLKELRIKRLFALSSVSNIGFLFIALYIHSPLSIEAYFFYFFIYLTTLLFLFMLLINIGYFLLSNHENVSSNSPIQKLSHLCGLGKENGFLALSFTICLLSLLGIPPFIGFFLKQKVILSTLANGSFLISFIAILTSVISAVYYLKIIEYIYFKKDVINHWKQPLYQNITNSNHYAILTNEMSFLIAFFTLFLTFFILHPNFFLNCAEILALSYFIN